MGEGFEAGKSDDANYPTGTVCRKRSLKHRQPFVSRPEIPYEPLAFSGCEISR